MAVAAGVAASAAAAGPSPAPAGDALAGRELFLGARRFQAGGAPCGACHALGGQGLAFDASLGPELSSSLSGLDPEALQGLLESLPFPSMVPIYADRALTPRERADLGAFLAGAAKAGPPVPSRRFEIYAALLAAALLGVVYLAGRRRRRGSIRQRLLEQAGSAQGGSR
jgi:mono/diheme cytochrome c family protein